MARPISLNPVWLLLDPILLRVRSRLEHLSEVSPSTRHEQQIRRKATIDASATVSLGCAIDAMGPPENLSVGAYSVICGQLATVTSSAILRVGHHSFLGQGSRIWAQESVLIGDHVLIAHLVDIHDTNSHSVRWPDRRADSIKQYEERVQLDHQRVTSAPVIIEDDVWIGFKSTVLKGVTIGRGAVIAAGSLVTHDIPPFTLVAGAPARVVRRLEPAE